MTKTKKQADMLMMYETLDSLDESLQNEIKRKGRHEAEGAVNQLLHVIELKIDIISKLNYT